MGNRDDLLVAARQCLLDKGYDRTTVRDLASAANVGMAAIGYHYGSREALLTEALSQAVADWGDRVARALAPDPLAADTPAAQFESTLTRLIDSFAADRRLWLVGLEAFLQAQRSPELKAQLATAAPVDVRAVDTVRLALISGLMLQFLSDEEAVPTATDVLTDLRALLDGGAG